MAKDDPEVNLNADPDAPAYQPRALEVYNRCCTRVDHVY